MNFATDNGQSWLGFKLLGRGFEFRKDQQRQQECTDDVHSEGALMPLGRRVVLRGYAGVLEKYVDALQIRSATGKAFD